MRFLSGQSIPLKGTAQSERSVAMGEKPKKNGKKIEKVQTKTVKKKAEKLPKSSRLEITEDMISARAHQIWLDEGCPEGRSIEHWVKAELELRTR